MNRACLAVKRIPCSSTKGTRYKVSMGSGSPRVKFYSLEVVPLEVYDKNDEEIALYLAELYMSQRDLQWTLSPLSTIYKGEYIFIAM